MLSFYPTTGTGEWQESALSDMPAPEAGGGNCPVADCGSDMIGFHLYRKEARHFEQRREEEQWRKYVQSAVSSSFFWE